MAYDQSPIPWTDEQWARIEDTIQQEASRARVAATFLPLYGPLPPETDFVRAEKLHEPPAVPYTEIEIEDKSTVQLATLQVKVRLRAAQMAQPELTSALQMFRRAANVLARLEDVVVFRGLEVPIAGGPGQLPAGVTGFVPAGLWEIAGAQDSDGLWSVADARKETFAGRPQDRGESLVSAVSASIGRIEDQGHFGPFAVVLGQGLFTVAETPSRGSLVLPQDRIIPFLGGGSFLRSSALEPGTGVVVALGGAPVDLVVATDMSLGFLQVTDEPKFVFRVFEKIVLRIKQPEAIRGLEAT